MAVVLLILVVGMIAAAGFLLFSPRPPDQALIPTFTPSFVLLPPTATLTTLPTLAPAPSAAPFIKTNTPVRPATSLPSSTAIPATMAPATPTIPTAFSGWKAEYYTNPTLDGTAQLIRDDAVINFNWETNAPAPGLPNDGFSARWTRSVTLDEGMYRYSARADDGVRLWVDGELLIDQWHDAAGTLYTADRALTGGHHDIRVEYYDNQRTAILQVWWDRIGDAPFWLGEYFSNPSLSGAPSSIRSDPTVNFAWGSNTPASGIAPDAFSVRWTRRLDAEAGTYRFTLAVDDGARLYIDDNPVIDEWRDGSLREAAANYSLTKGSHILRLEYYERTGDAVVRLRWEPLSTADFPNWRAEYYANQNLQGPPLLVRNDQSINFDWGGTAPSQGFPVENWSARWARQINFTIGTYRFRIVADDGVRLYVDNTLVLDQWHDSGGTPGYSVDLPLAGVHTITVEYYEHAGSARAQLSIDAIATPTVTPFPTASYTATRTPTLTNTSTATSTRTPSNTSSPTATRTATATITSTSSPTRTYTPTSPTAPTVTRTSTSTATPTLTSAPTATLTQSPTATATRTSTPTSTPTVTATISVALTPPAELAFNRVASPDKVWVAAINATTGGLDLIRNDGQTTSLFTSGPVGPVTWSPDSSRLLIVSIQHPAGIGSVLSLVGIAAPAEVRVFQVRISGGKPSTLTLLVNVPVSDASLAGKALWGQWSPNSRYVLFWIGPESPSLQADGLTLRLIDADAGQISTLENTLLNPGYQSWSPDSSRLALTAGGNRSAQTNKWIDIYDPASATLTTVVSRTEQIPGILSWSPRGDLIAYAAVTANDAITNTADSSFKSPLIANRRIYLLNVATGTRTRLNNRDAFQDAPEWSSDGKTLYYAQQDATSIMLAASNPITSTPQLVQESRRPAPQSVGYYGQSNWQDILAYRPDLTRADVPALSDALTDSVTGLSFRFPSGWVKSTEWHTAGFECAGCTSLRAQALDTELDLRPFSGNLYIGLQLIANPEGSIELGLTRVLANPGPDQFLEHGNLVTFGLQQVQVDEHRATRMETMDEFGNINHVLVVFSGRQLLVMRARGDQRVFDAIAATIQVK